MESSISLEETNKIRISLGLKPLTDDGAPTDNKEKEAEDNFAKRKQAEAREKEQSEIVARIQKNKNRRELNRRLVGTTLGDAEEDADDTLKWVKKAKKKEKELAKKRMQDIEKMDKLHQDDYSEKDLVGLKVSHDFEGLGEGEDRILTLKDSRILDNEEDELQNIDMAEEEQDKKRFENKIKKHDYKGYDDDEFLGGSEGIKRAILAKYDEVIDGTTETGFRLGDSIPKSAQQVRQDKEQLAASVNKSLLSIDYAKNMETSDYVKEGDVGFKKPKTKKKRSSRRAPLEPEAPIAAPAENGISASMDVDEKKPILPPPDLDANFVDDDELQAALARTRRTKVKKAKITPEEIARRVAEERAEEEALAQQTGESRIVVEDDDDDAGLTFDETSEFVRAISYNPAPIKTESQPEPQPKKEAIVIQINTNRQRSEARGSGEGMDVDEAVGEIEAGEVDIKEEEDEEAMLMALENMISTSGEDAVKKEVDQTDADDLITSNAYTFSSGMAGTLKILQQQGILKTVSDDAQERDRNQKAHDKWLADHRRRIAQRELDRLRSRNSNKDQATREYENRQREQQEAREQQEEFKNYKPDINIKYHDEFGREMTDKEAWKALSHRFHGKGSGRMKTEKRLKKIAEEKKKEAMASGDTPLSMNRAFQIRQEKAGQAHMVLSVGNRGAVPQATEFLDAPNLSKGRNEKGKGKKKDSGKAPTPVIDMTGFTNHPPLEPLGGLSHSAATSGAAIGSLPSSHSGSPAPPLMMKSSFSRISGEPTMDKESSRSPAADRTKVAFGFGTKRKAAEDGGSTPPAKSRR